MQEKFLFHEPLRLELVSNFFDLLFVFESEHFVDDFAFHFDFWNEVVYWSVVVNVDEWNVLLWVFLG